MIKCRLIVFLGKGVAFFSKKHLNMPAFCTKVAKKY